MTPITEPAAIPTMTYSNGSGNVQRLPDRVVDTLIDSAGVSRCALGRGIGVRDQSAEVERLVHDVCEELLARLPAAPPPVPGPILSDQRILQLLCAHTGRRVSLLQAEVFENIAFARALLAPTHLA